MKKSRGNRGQFSIIAALLVSVILVAAVIMTYSVIRHNPSRESPKVLTSIGEINSAIKRILEFTVGYYGSILQVTGNSTYAKGLAASYLRSGLVNIAHSHPDWNPSFDVDFQQVSTLWFMPESYSMGNISVTYSLSGLGMQGVDYETSSLLKATILEPANVDEAWVLVMREDNEPELRLKTENFFFYNYSYSDSTWNLVNPESDPLAYSNGTYVLEIPSGVDQDSFSLQVVDPRGIKVTAFFSEGSLASGVPQYAYTFDWNATGKEHIYSSLSRDTIVVEALQNGTLRWLGQNLQLSTQEKPIPPVPVKALHINWTVDGVSQEVPFQVEDWGSNYKVPLGLTSNASVFNNRNMLAFLVNHRVQKVTLWWDGRDIANQTSYAWKNRYFNDDPDNGVLSNVDLTLYVGVEHLYVNSFSGSRTEWVEEGSSPYLNDDDSNWIWDDDNYDRERYFYFEDPITSSGGVGEARIQFECRGDGDDYFQFRIYNGYWTSSWYSIIGLPSSYGWKEYDVSGSRFDSLTEVSNARIEIRYRRSGSTSSDVFIRRCRLVVEVGLKVESNVGTSVAQSEFLRINGERPVYGADPAYVIYNGSVRDIVQQEAEWGGGATSCPDLYSQIVLTLPANTTYYTYAVRTIFVSTFQTRTLNELNALELSIYPGESGTGECITEDGINATGFPIPSYSEGLFYNSSSPTGWAHHWSEFLKGNNGAGIMFTNNSNFKLYTFDSSEYAGDKTGALDVDKQASDTNGHIELNPVERFPVSFTNPLDVTWHGAVVTFDSDSSEDTIYPSSGGDTGLWVIVEYPPVIAVS